MINAKRWNDGAAVNEWLSWLSWLAITVGLALGIVAAMIALGVLTLLLGALMPAKIWPRECVCCGRVGYWDRRTSLGYHKCDACAAGPHMHELLGPITSTLLHHADDIVSVHDVQHRL
jgi:hypothetical protein